ncbi:hypothetical protein [Kribbella italica]|uniref:Uncharacterized protein n=1 Tax=Kribbella italica TaxID=1540520 RepID=A0A7W9MSY7_9ACTN|nr:hypothetical protein [Kribbella italica]MBB5834378.1 hypothetical protein [Kribbella italica]
MVYTPDVRSFGGRQLTEDERAFIATMEGGRRKLTPMDRGRLAAYRLRGDELDRARIDHITGGPKIEGASEQTAEDEIDVDALVDKAVDRALRKAGLAE